MIGFETDVVPFVLVQQILRVIHLDLRWRGVSAEELHQWGQHPWPHLLEHGTILEAGRLVQRRLRPEGIMDTPQIVWQLPDERLDLTLTSHVDVPPEGHVFTLIAGLALTDWRQGNGTVHVWTKGLPEPVWLSPGSVLWMTPETEHSPGLNGSGLPRVGVYYRWMKPES